MDCIFCKIVVGEIPSHKVFEDDTVLVFLDIKPLTRGHMLLIPKTHSEGLYDISSETLAHISKTAQRLAKDVKPKLAADGFNLLQSTGAVAHQEVLHFHLHLIPRYKEDGVVLSPSHPDVQFDLATVLAEITTK